MGFDHGFERPTCLATLKSSDRTKQSVCGWQYVCVYLSSISSLMHIQLNNIDIFCLHIFVCLFELLHWFYGTRRELVNETLNNYLLPKYFLQYLGPSSCKSNVTFSCMAVFLTSLVAIFFFIFRSPPFSFFPAFFFLG